MMLIYDLPNWLIGIMTVFVMSGIALGGFYLWKKCIKWENNEDANGNAIAILGVVAMVLSLLLAFSAVSVWEAYSGADSAAAAEASVSGELVRDLAVYGIDAKPSRMAVRDYLNSVITDEWIAMSKGENAETSAHKFNVIFHKIALIEPKNKQQEILLAEIWGKVNQLNEYRRGRLNIASGSAVPGALWGTIIFGIIFNYILFFLLPYNKFNRFLLAVYAAMLGLLLFFIIVMDHPFTGSVSVSPYAYEQAIKSMDRWDTEEQNLGQ